MCYFIDDEGAYSIPLEAAFGKSVCLLRASLQLRWYILLIPRAWQVAREYWLMMTCGFLIYDLCLMLWHRSLRDTLMMVREPLPWCISWR